MSRLFSNAAGDHLDASYTMPALPFTACAWLKLNTFGTGIRIFDLGSDGTHRYSLGTSAADAAVAHHHDGTLSVATETAHPLSDGQWHVAVGSWVGNSSRSAFSDGINKGTNAGARTSITPTAIVVGQDFAALARLNGRMAHLAIWGGTLSDADISLLATVSPNMVRPDILLDYWPLQSNSASEPSYGSRGTILSVTGTAFSTDDPVLNAGIIQPMYFNRKQMFYV